MNPPQLTDLRTVGERTVQRLSEHGFHAVADLATATIEQIRTVPGFGVYRASMVRQAAVRVLEEVGEDTSVKKDKKKDKKGKKGKARKMGKKDDDKKKADKKADKKKADKKADKKKADKKKADKKKAGKKKAGKKKAGKKKKK